MSDGVLNLDDLFGKSRPVRVVFKGVEYELLRPESLSPAQYSDWLRLQKQVEVIRAKGKDLTEKDFQEWDGLLSEVLGMLCQKFVAAEPSFQVRSKALEFYFQETFKDLQPGESPKNPTGAERSPD